MKTPHDSFFFRENNKLKSIKLSTIKGLWLFMRQLYFTDDVSGATMIQWMNS